MAVRNFKQFIPGNYYIYTGTEREKDWDATGAQDFVLAHEVHRCLEADYRFFATFENLIAYGPMEFLWWKSGFDNWIEVGGNVYMTMGKIEPSAEYFYSVTQNKIVHRTEVLHHYNLPEDKRAFKVFKELTRPPLNIRKDLEDAYGINFHKVVNQSCGCIGTDIPVKTETDFPLGIQDIFAGTVLGALISHKDFYVNWTDAQLIQTAYNMADLMVKERRKRYGRGKS